MAAEEEKGFIKKYGAIFGLISLIVSVFTFPVSIYFTWHADYLSQINSNFNSKVIPLSSSTSFNSLTWYYPNGTFISGGSDISGDSPTPSVASGFLNISLAVSTPHVAVLNISNAKDIYSNFIINPQSPTSAGQISPISFGAINAYWLEPTLMNRTVIFNLPSQTTYQYFIQEGVQQIDFSIPVQVDFYINPDYVRLLNGSLVGGDGISVLSNPNLQGKSYASWFNPLGTVNITVQLQDLQTNLIVSQTILTDVKVPIFCQY